MTGFDIEFSGADEAGGGRLLILSAQYMIGKRLRRAPRIWLDEFAPRAKHVYFNRAETSFFTEIAGERVEVHVADEADVMQRQGRIEVAVTYPVSLAQDKAQQFAQEVLQAAFEDRQAHSSRALMPQIAERERMKVI